MKTWVSKCVSAAGLALIIMMSQAQAATSVYTDRAAFDLATGGGLSLEDFSDGLLNPAAFGVTGTNVFVTSGGELHGRPTISGDNMSFSFASPVTAFGGDFDTSRGGAGIGLQFALDSGEVVSEELIAPLVAFWGFVADSPFSTMTVSGGSGLGIAETHVVDNVSFGVASAVAPIPLPASLSLLLAALGGAFGWRLLGRPRIGQTT